MRQPKKILKVKSKKMVKMMLVVNQMKQRITTLKAEKRQMEMKKWKTMRNQVKTSHNDNGCDSRNRASFWCQMMKLNTFLLFS